MTERPVAVVTGAGSGMGKATAARLAERGWCVVAGDVVADRLAWVEGHAGIVAVVSDVATEVGNAALVDAAEGEFGQLDAAVLNAAVIAGGPLEAVAIEEFDRMYVVNLRGVVLGLRAVVPALRRRGGGAVSVTASMGGVEGELYNWAYGSTKAGVINVVQSAAMEFGREGIRINALCPGPVQHTGMSEQAETVPDIYDAVKGMTALKRWGEPEEIAAVHEFLISPESSFITGATILVDGGVTAGHTWIR